VSVRTAFIRSIFVLIVSAVAVPAAAQQPGLQLSKAQTQALFTSMSRDEAPAAVQGGDRPMIIRVHAGGVFCCDGTGFILGGGVGARPFNNQQVEVAGDFSFMRFEGDNGVYVSGNGYYHFKTSEPKFSPFAGAGLAILHIFEETEVRFQIAGGLELNSDKANPIRPEIRFIFTEGDVTTVLMVSIGVGRR
jgi:hypothetical protein